MRKRAHSADQPSGPLAKLEPKALRSLLFNEVMIENATNMACDFSVRAHRNHMRANGLMELWAKERKQRAEKANA